MLAVERSLHPVQATPSESSLGGLAPDVRSALPGFGPGDALLTAGILLVGLLPFICDRLGVGEWSAGTLGFAAVGAVLAGRELLLGLARRRHGGDRSAPR